MAAGTNSQAASLAKEIAGRVSVLPSHDTATLRTLRREFSKRLAASEPREVVATALLLLQQRPVPRFIAYELICHHKEAPRILGPGEIEALGAGLDSWGAVDCFACFIAGRAWREHQLPDRLIHSWACSHDRWWRRAALVSTIPLNSMAHGGGSKGDAVRTLKVCESLVDDRDDMVVKALSWALRELSKRDPDAVQGFVGEYEERLAARVIREVRTKLATGLKNPGASRKR